MKCHCVYHNLNSVWRKFSNVRSEIPCYPFTWRELCVTTGGRNGGHEGGLPQSVENFSNLKWIRAVFVNFPGKSKKLSQFSKKHENIWLCVNNSAVWNKLRNFFVRHCILWEKLQKFLQVSDHRHTICTNKTGVRNYAGVNVSRVNDFRTLSPEKSFIVRMCSLLLFGL